jgi:hypothetical protein
MLIVVIVILIFIFLVGVLDIGDCCASQVSFTRLIDLWSCIL